MPELPKPELSVERTPIPGMLVVHLPVHGDARGWFKENWQRAKMTALGLPDFGPVQNNMSFNAARGATRGIHAEPWDKFVSVALGRVFAAWVDLREGPSFGATFWTEIDESVAVFVPRGVANSYQALADNTVYSYLVNAHWQAGLSYPALALDDPTAAIPWPIPLARAEISAKDRTNPHLADAVRMPARKTLILGAGGQLGQALAAAFPGAVLAGREHLDITDAAAVAAWPWAEYGLVLNAAAMTAVDAAETPQGRAQAWAVNAQAPALLAQAATSHRLTLVHISSDYVFNGSGPAGHLEDEPFSPLGVYGQSKAAGDIAVATTARHYIVRTSWVIGEGNNFVRTMARLASEGISPAVVADQIGRLSFTGTLAAAIAHLVNTEAAFGTYNVTNTGTPASWQQIAAAVFEHRGRAAADVRPTSTEDYFAAQAAAGKAISPRPLNSVLSLDKLLATGFTPADQFQALDAYLNSSA